MFCAISGEPPQEPVISRKSGHVFEKRLILKYLADHGKDPITNEETSEEDLLEIKASPKTVKPRPATVTSIPSLLNVFQNEWDALMLETFTLKQQYQQVRQELSHALYQHDAACRVIARLMKERDAARDALAKIQAHMTQPQDSAAPQTLDMDVEMADTGITSAIKAKLDETRESLSKGRKKRKAPPDLTTPDEVQNYNQISVTPSLHTARSPGITCLDLDKDEQLVITGGNDKNAHIYDRSAEKVVAALKGHTKKITDVSWRGKVENERGDVALTASADKTVKIWQPSDNGYRVTTTITTHENEVSGIALHPTKDYLVSVSHDSTWAFHDVETGRSLVRVESADVRNGYASVEFHPDGIIFGTGTNDSVVRIWDIKNQENLVSFGADKSDPSNPIFTGAVRSIAFSENGYYLATASEDNLVRLWDLRKQTNVHTITLPEDARVNKVVWDYSGQYLAVAGTDVRVYHSKTWNELVVLHENTAEVTGIKFGTLARCIVVGGLDRSLRFYGVSADERMSSD